jgi:2,3-bisphosphoglycerate-dependent phosphoglycerate mutase
MHTLVLLRHGQSEGNARSVFTGWIDVPLTDEGRAEAVRSGELLAEAGIRPDVVHTSVLRRAIGTAALTLDACDRHWIPTHRSWRLNERHYGSLQGRSKSAILTEFGEEQYDAWRRSRDAAPPPSSEAEFLRLANDPRYAAMAPELIPRTESHAQVGARLLPYWLSSIAPELLAGRVACVVAHGNSLRALVKHFDPTSAGLDIPTGIPLVYELDDSLSPTAPGGRYLDAERAAIAIAAIAREGRPSG